MSREVLQLQNRHTEERLSLRAIHHEGQLCLELKGSLPARSEGPPLHVHFVENEEGVVRSGTLSAILDGQRLTVGSGQSASFAAGSVHRWWNEGDELLVFDGIARPLVDLDRLLEAVFEVLNAGPSGRPDPFYMAHLALRHWNTQYLAVMPRPVQAVLFRVMVAVGTVMGKYRGTDWPGCPARCIGVDRTAARNTAAGSPSGAGI